MMKNITVLDCSTGVFCFSPAIATARCWYDSNKLAKGTRASFMNQTVSCYISCGQGTEAHTMKRALRNLRSNREFIHMLQENWMKQEWAQIILIINNSFIMCLLYLEGGGPISESGVNQVDFFVLVHDKIYPFFCRCKNYTETTRRQ